MKRLGLIFSLAIMLGWTLMNVEPAEARVRFDPGAVQTVSGQVVSVNRVRVGRGARVRLLLATPTERIPITLGPAGYIAGQKFILAPGDQVSITGSRVAGRRGKPVFIPTEVNKQDQVLRLRDASGVPLWRGRRR
jgi:hypothetical protein